MEAQQILRVPMDPVVVVVRRMQDQVVREDRALNGIQPMVQVVVEEAVALISMVKMAELVVAMVEEVVELVRLLAMQELAVLVVLLSLSSRSYCRIQAPQKSTQQLLLFLD
jgi:hypothetical protein